ncbi:MAG: YjgP/YjgQ family permease [Desulfobulbaceae bacterium]|nr:YjgP/YjgQ family permease [Desulfobulbaceae bacterium]
MPLLLYSYLISEILSPFFAGLLVINAILFLGKLSSLLDVIFGFGIGFGDFARISLYLLPSLLQYSLPMASTVAVIVSFTRLSGDNEILALKAAGCGLRQLLIPVVLVALFTAGLTALTTCVLIPRGNLALKKTFYQLAREKIDQGLRGREFSDSLDKVVIYIDQVNPASKEWSGVYISDRRDPANPLTILARSGSLTADAEEMFITLALRDGSIHRNRQEITQTMTFGDYRLQLPLNSGAGGLDPSFDPKKLGKNDLNPNQLLAKAEELKLQARTDPNLHNFYLEQSTGLVSEFHSRLALPTGCLLLTILALPLSLQSRPGRGNSGLPLGLFFFVLYYLLISLAQSQANTSGLPIALLMWTPNLLFTLLTLVALRASARENSVPFLEHLLEWAGNLTTAWKGWRRRRQMP